MNVDEIVKELKDGRVVEIPTDTVNGLICDYYNKEAEKKIFEIKKRPEDKIICIFVSSIEEAENIVKIGEKQKKFLHKVWPGKVTCVLKKDIGGFRIPNDKFVLEILKKFGGPLLQTSANISGEPPVGGLPSTVVDITGNELKIIREGAIPAAELQKIWSRCNIEDPRPPNS